MSDEILLSTAYFPPAEYFSHIKRADNILIEREENYIKQTYRNRCRILTSHGIQVLSVPVLKSNRLKTPSKETLIDYSKRWQQIHLRALISAYNSSPYFQYYFEQISHRIMKNLKYLLDLNNELLEICLGFLNMIKCISYTLSFKPPTGDDNDFRYNISPKYPSDYQQMEYYQVFGENGFVAGLSILDLLFNMGPDSERFL
jgi:hypothetical protein